MSGSPDITFGKDELPKDKDLRVSDLGKPTNFLLKNSF